MGVWSGIAGVNADVNSEDDPFAENLWFNASLNPGVASPSEGFVEEAGDFELKKSIIKNYLGFGQNKISTAVEVGITHRIGFSWV